MSDVGHTLIESVSPFVSYFTNLGVAPTQETCL